MAPGTGSLLVDVVGQAPDVDAVMAAISRTLRRSLGVGPVFLAPADPLTGAFSGAFVFDIPASAAQAFSEIERRDRDIASFRSIAAGPGAPVASLYREADRRPEKSERWREVIEPLHWGDEIRAVVRSHGHTWGYLCLHREAGERSFDERDAERLVALLPAVAFAMRTASTLADQDPIENATGTPNRSSATSTGPARRTAAARSSTDPPTACRRPERTNPPSRPVSRSRAAGLVS